MHSRPDAALNLMIKVSPLFSSELFFKTEQCYNGGSPARVHGPAKVSKQQTRKFGSCKVLSPGCGRLVLYEVPTAANIYLNVGEIEVTFLEERQTLIPKISTFKARETRAMSVVTINANNVIHVVDDHGDNEVVAASVIN